LRGGKGSKKKSVTKNLPGTDRKRRGGGGGGFSANKGSPRKRRKADACKPGKDFKRPTKVVGKKTRTAGQGVKRNDVVPGEGKTRPRGKGG